MRQRIALAGLADKQRAARVGKHRTGVGRQHRDQDQRRAVGVGGDADPAASGEPVLGSITARAPKRALRINVLASLIASASVSRMTSFFGSSKMLTRLS